MVAFFYKSTIGPCFRLSSVSTCGFTEKATVIFFYLVSLVLINDPKKQQFCLEPGHLEIFQCSTEGCQGFNPNLGLRGRVQTPRTPSTTPMQNMELEFWEESSQQKLQAGADSSRSSLGHTASQTKLAQACRVFFTQILFMQQKQQSRRCHAVPTFLKMNSFDLYVIRFFCDFPDKLTQ